MGNVRGFEETLPKVCGMVIWAVPEGEEKGVYRAGPVPDFGKIRLRIHRVFKDDERVYKLQQPGRLTGGNKILAMNADIANTYRTA